jgi:hypothetical protein
VRFLEQLQDDLVGGGANVGPATQTHDLPQVLAGDGPYLEKLVGMHALPGGVLRASKFKINQGEAAAASAEMRRKPLRTRLSREFPKAGLIRRGTWGPSHQRQECSRKITGLYNPDNSLLTWRCILQG